MLGRWGLRVWFLVVAVFVYGYLDDDSELDRVFSCTFFAAATLALLTLRDHMRLTTLLAFLGFFEASRRASEPLETRPYLIALSLDTREFWLSTRFALFLILALLHATRRRVPSEESYASV